MAASVKGRNRVATRCAVAGRGKDGITRPGQSSLTRHLPARAAAHEYPISMTMAPRAKASLVVTALGPLVLAKTIHVRMAASGVSDAHRLSFDVSGPTTSS